MCDVEEDVEDVPCCPICSRIWREEEFALERELHVNKCLERIELVCPICQATHFDSALALERHASSCLDFTQSDKGAGGKEEEGEQQTQCPVCLTSLLLLSLPLRIRHVKACARENQVLGPRDLEENLGMLDMLIEQSELVEHSPIVEEDLITTPSSNKSEITDYFESNQKRAKVSPTCLFQSSKPWRTCPEYKKIPHCSIVVDAFQYASAELASIYLLSHFHYDHYIGLTREFDCGAIFCSPTTARLLHLVLKIPARRVQVLRLGSRTQVGPDTFVTALDANHCPGSLVFVIETPRRELFVHTGDFRATDALAHAIKSMAQRLLRPVHTVFLDTTYCNVEHGKLLPNQDVVLASLRERMEQQHWKEKRTLIVIGTYTIGKERLALEVASAVGGSKIAVTKQKLNLLRACDGFSTQVLAERFTTERSLARIWLVPMHALEHGKLVQLRRKHANRFDKILAIRGTGWVKHFRETALDCITTLLVPYSEHSSLPELASFVRIVNPKRVEPTVYARGSRKQGMLDLLLY